jgi:TIR domain
VTSVLLLLVVGVYFLLNSNVSGINGMMGSVPTTTNNWVISLVLISIAIIISVAIVLYSIYSKKEKNERIKIETRSNINPAIEGSLSTRSEKEVTRDGGSKPFDVFLCYKKSSGKDYADHLKAGLEELGLHTFEDCKDIPQTVDTEEGWAKVRDKALVESKYFVLIMTPGFNLSPEVIKEISMARKQANKTFVYFRHRSMGRNIVVNLGNEILDIGKLEQVSFETKEELLRLASNILLKFKTT